MLEKLVVRNITEVGDLLALADKCMRKVEGHHWNDPRASQPGMNYQQGSWPKHRDKKKNKAPEQGAICAAGARGSDTLQKNKKPRGDPHQPLAQKKWCSIHNRDSHDLADCRSVKNLAERLYQRAQEQ